MHSGLTLDLVRLVIMSVTLSSVSYVVICDQVNSGVI